MKFYALGASGLPTGEVFELIANVSVATYVLDDNEGLALLRAVGGERLVQEYLAEQRALEEWDNEGGYRGGA